MSRRGRREVSLYAVASKAEAEAGTSTTKRTWTPQRIFQAIAALGGGLSNLIEDLTPQLGGDLDVNGQNIVSTSDGDIAIVPNGTGDIILDGQKWPQSDGTNTQIPQTDGAGQLSWVDKPAGSGDSLPIVDINNIVKGSTDATKQVRIEADTNITTGTTRVITMADEDIDLTPGSGSFIKDIVSDTTPQLGGDLDLNGKNLDFPTIANISDCLDEDDLTSDSPTALATQQSIKAYVDAAGGGLAFIESQDASASATLNFTGFSAASYDSYLFILSNVIPSTDVQSLWIRTSTDGGSNYDLGASDYKSNRMGRLDSSANDFWITRGGSAAQISMNLLVNTGSAANEDGMSGRLWVYGPHLIKRTIMEYSVTFITSDGDLESSQGGFMRDSAADVDALQFLFASGNVASGTITMYGLVNA